MDLRSIREASFVARFIHLLFLAAIVALGVHFQSRALVVVLTAVWFVLFMVIYHFTKNRRQ